MKGLWGLVPSGGQGQAGSGERRTAHLRMPTFLHYAGPRMSISAPFIARPIATCLLAVAVLLGGALGYRALPVSALPQVDFPTIVVTTLYPGAGPETISTLVTAPLERQLGQINGIGSMQ